MVCVMAVNTGCVYGVYHGGAVCVCKEECNLNTSCVHGVYHGGEYSQNTGCVYGAVCPSGGSNLNTCCVHSVCHMGRCCVCFLLRVCTDNFQCILQGIDFCFYGYTNCFHVSLEL